MKQQPYILTIAGHDPSSGAGLTSDIKTFEAHGLYGLSVCTAITVQNDIEFKKCIWTPKDIVIEQLKTLFERFEISVVKIGIIQSWSVLLEVVQILKRYNPSVKIVLDPILKASAGFDFHSEEHIKMFEEVLQYCDFITPNYDEINAFFPNKSIKETIEFISEKTNIYLKGGHREDKKGWDMLYRKKRLKLNIPPKAKTIFEKHGSGCVLSSTLASNIFNQVSIKKACKKAKLYTELFLNSNKTLLGEHFYK